MRRDVHSMSKQITGFEDKLSSKTPGAEEEFAAFKLSRTALVKSVTEVNTIYHLRDCDNDNTFKTLAC